MKQLLEDTLKVSALLKELLLAPTPLGRLHVLIRLSCPNWTARQCFKAGRWMRRNGLRPRSAFAGDEQYLGYLQQQLLAYAEAFPQKARYEVADELSLSRWEARWQRVRTRQSHHDTMDSARPARFSSAA